MNRRFALGILLCTPLVYVAGCGKTPSGSSGSHHPVPIGPGDECHVCGMLIKRFPGPKGEAYVQGRKVPYKFCSTRDLFAWLLQPETTTVVRQVFVQDMGATEWAHPSDKAFIDARQAWYVVGSDAKAAMGPTLPSFGQRADAERFSARHGGRVLRFDAIDLAVLDSLNRTGAGADAAAAKGMSTDQVMPMGGAKAGHRH